MNRTGTAARRGSILLVFVLVPVCVMAQAVDTIIYFPDSLVGATYPTAVCSDVDGCKAYVGGSGGLPAVVVLDGVTMQKTARIAVSEDIVQILSSSAVPFGFALGRHRLTCIDTEADTVVTELDYGNGPGLGVVAHDWLYIADNLYGSVLKVRGSDLAVLDSIAVQLTPVAVAYDYPRVFVAGQQGSVAVIDVETDSVVAELVVGDSPSCLVAAPGLNRVFCANRLGNTVSVIDPDLDSVIATIPVGAGPEALAVDESLRKLFVANRNGGSVSVIDCDSLRVVATVSVTAPQSLVVEPGASRVRVGTAGDLHVVIDGVTNSIITMLPVGGDCRALVWLDSAGVAVAPSRECGTAAFLRNTAVVATAQVSSSYPSAALASGHWLWVAHERASRVDKYDLRGYTYMGSVDVPAGPVALCYSSYNGSIYCACRDAGKVVRIASNLTVANEYETGNSPSTLAYDLQDYKVYCGNYGSPELTVIGCVQDSVIARVPVGRGTRRVVYNPVSNKVYLACHDSYTIEVVDCAGDSVLAAFGGNGNPWTVVVDETDNLVYGSTSWGGPVICGAGDTLVGNISQVFYVKGSCWNPVNSYVYQAKNFDDVVLVIDGPTHTVVDQVAVQDYPAEMASMLTTGRVYLAHRYSRVRTDRVSVIEADSLLGSVTVAPRPAALIPDDPHGKMYVLSDEGNCMTVLHDHQVGVAECDPTASFPSVSARPNPFTDRVALECATVPPGATAAVVYDASGRRVRRLGELRPGLDWDGTDDAGRQVQPGVYFVRTGLESLRLIRLR